MATEFQGRLAVGSSPHVKSPLTVRQVMQSVCIALLPALIASVYFFGLRALVLTAVCVASCVIFEHLFAKVTRTPSPIGDLSAVVTGLILAFNLPVTLPFWMAAFGAFIAIVVIKGLFGGIGCNFANPAATARIFLLVAFAGPMTTWAAPLRGAAPAAGNLLSSFAGVDYIAGATPLSGHMAALPSLMQMFLGAHGGSLGETSALALLIGGVYLIWKGIIKFDIPVAVIASVFVFALLFGQNPVYAILSGGVMIGAFFMATDYSTSPMTTRGRIIFGVGIGFLTMVIRTFCAYPEGMSFAILLLNILAPHIENLTIPTPFSAVMEKKAAKGGDAK